MYLTINPRSIKWPWPKVRGSFSFFTWLWLNQMVPKDKILPEAWKSTAYHLWFKSKDPHVWGKKTGSKFKSFCCKWKVNSASKQHNTSSVVASFFADDILDTSHYSKLLYIKEMLSPHYLIPLLSLYFSFIRCHEFSSVAGFILQALYCYKSHFPRRAS